jgi:hypothetical protein
MKDPLKEWLGERANTAGIIACGFRRANGKFLCHSNDVACPPDKMERILRLLDGTRPVIAGAGLAPRWSNWSFGQGQIRFVTRHDGWMFAVAVRNETDIAQHLDVLATEFLALELTR